MSTKQIFDDFPSVECDNCEMYYTNRCDGSDMPLKGSYSPCKSFLPVRNVTIPNDIKKLQNDVKWLGISVCILGLSIILLGIERLL